MHTKPHQPYWKFTFNLYDTPNKNITMINNVSELRKHEIIWYTPPFSLQIKSLPKLFFKILKTNFPKPHKYYSIFNKSSVKVCFSTSSNSGSIISSINWKLVHKPLNLMSWIKYKKLGQFPKYITCSFNNCLIWNWYS